MKAAGFTASHWVGNLRSSLVYRLSYRHQWNRNLSVAQLEKYINIEAPRNVTKQIWRKREVSISQKKISGTFGDTKTNQKLNCLIRSRAKSEEIERRKSLISGRGH